MTQSAAELVAATAFDQDGLVPVVVQEAETGVVRMLAWANDEALEKTVETGLAHFWSRGQGALWRKGETSGNTLVVRQIRLDCDGDVVLYLADPEGPTCHTGATSCFTRPLADDGKLSHDDRPPDPPAVILTRVAEVIAHRRRERTSGSYTVELLQAGWPKMLGKITEEACELIQALPSGDKAHTAREAADLLFHVMVALEAADLSIAEVFAELRRRFGVSGLVEKASRAR